MDLNKHKEELALLFLIIFLFLITQPNTNNTNNTNFFKQEYWIDETYISLSNSKISFDYIGDKQYGIREGETIDIYYYIPRYGYFSNSNENLCDSIYGSLEQYYNKCWVTENTFKKATYNVNVDSRVGSVSCVFDGYSVFNREYVLKITCTKSGDPDHWRIYINPRIWGTMTYNQETTTTTTTSTTVTGPCSQYYGAEDYITCPDCTLYSGEDGNFFVYNGETKDIEEALGEISNKITAIWYYDGTDYSEEDGNWYVWSPGESPDNLHELVNGECYWAGVFNDVFWSSPETTTTSSSTTTSTTSYTTTVNTTTTSTTMTTIIECEKDSDCEKGFICKDGKCVEGVRPVNYSLYIIIAIVIIILIVLAMSIGKEKYPYPYGGWY